MLKRLGFTLIELVIIIVIIGLLISVALPRFMNFSDKSRVQADLAVVNALKSAVELVATKARTTGQSVSDYAVVQVNNNDYVCVNSLLQPVPQSSPVTAASTPASCAANLLSSPTNCYTMFKSLLHNVPFPSVTTAAGSCYLDPPRSVTSNWCYIRYTYTSIGNIKLSTLVDDGNYIDCY